MPHERLKPDSFLDEERLKQLKEVVPEAFADGKINWSTLKDALGGELEDEEKCDEHFGLFWPGKRDARRLAGLPSKGTLVPVKGEGIDEETTGNIFIEGENLEVLKILRKSYTGKIKMIYIDPPYNTGNDFVYDDDFTEPLNEYLKRTGQIDGEGKPMTTNTKADGRFHSKWLSMMYPRLRLARELLREDGVIFVSIDDNEIHHLRLIMNEIFGEENFVVNFIWHRRQNADNRNENYASTDHEYILAFSKNNEFSFLGRQIDINKYTNPDNDPRGPWASVDLSGLATKDQRPNLHYDIVDPITGIVYPPNPKRGWSKSKESMQTLIMNNEILFPAKPDGRPRQKKFLNDLQSTQTGFSSMLRKDDVGFTTNGTQEFSQIFESRYFPFPKPKNLIRKLLEQTISSEPPIILDFFSGSATTAHSVLNLNNEDGGNRKFILVQMPELTEESTEAYKAGYKNIAEIGKERIRRVIKKIKEEKKADEKTKGKKLPGLEEENQNLQDLGFKVYKLSRSHYKPWENYHGDEIEKIENLFEAHQTPLVENWQEIEDGLLTEILLLEGFPLDSQIAKVDTFSKNLLREVHCSFHEHKLLVCFDEKIHADTVKKLELQDGDTFICLDTAINDEVKTTLSDKGLIKTI